MGSLPACLSRSPSSEAALAHPDVDARLHSPHGCRIWRLIHLAGTASKIEKGEHVAGGKGGYQGILRFYVFVRSPTAFPSGMR
jgi:hypothetical protein